jgi:hypothetical protein
MTMIPWPDRIERRGIERFPRIVARCRECPRQGTNQKGTGATSSYATRTRDQCGVLSSHNPLDSPNPLGGSGELIIRWSLVRVQPAPLTKPPISDPSLRPTDERRNRL